MKQKSQFLKANKMSNTLNPITIIFIDKEENLGKRVSEGSFDRSFFYDCLCVEKVGLLKPKLEELQSKSPKSMVVIYIHAFRNSDNWVSILAGNIAAIEKDFGTDSFIRIVTTDETAKVKEKFQGHDVDRYNDIMKKANNNNLGAKRIEEILKIDLQETSETKSKIEPVKKKLSDEVGLNDVTIDTGKFTVELAKFENDFADGTLGLYNDFNGFISFLKNGVNTNWLESLCKKTEHEYNNLQNFNNNYWGFESNFFVTYFSKDSINKYEIQKDPKQKNVHYDNSTKQWHINIRLFKSFFKQYPIDLSIIINQYQINNNSEEAEKIKLNNFSEIKRLMRLFLLHEALHKIHNIDEHSVFGIGNFPRIVEEADYQADAFVMISEFFFWYSANKQRTLTKEDIIKEFEEIIYVALNTTLSFAGFFQLPNIQVRRFNRYTIWLYILALINKLRTNGRITNQGEAISAVLDIFANKPILDIYGLSIELVEDDSDFNKDSKGTPPKHVCYNLEEVDTTKLDAAYLFENKVKRTAASTEKFKDLIDGIRNSQLSNLKEFVSSLESVI